MNSRILKSFKSIFEEKSLESYYNYYVSLRDWVIKNQNLFINELENNKRLIMLI